TFCTSDPEIYERLQSKLDRFQSSTASKIITDSTFDVYASSTILWEHITNENSTESLQGPFTTEQMICLTNTKEKLDKHNVRCRHVVQNNSIQ
ncbi:unnamed protein product, partial [Rotaria sp. Silwood1]